MLDLRRCEHWCEIKRVSASDVKYLANQMGLHESRIYGNDRDLRELMGTVGLIKEEVQKLESMNHCSHCQETLGQGHPMEETSIVHPVHGPGGKKKK